MTEAKATFEKVKAAVGLLQRGSKRPTVTDVRAVVGGGSRSTILRHMHTVFGQMADECPSSAMAEPSLRMVAEGLVRSVWTEAVAIATAEVDQRQRNLMDLYTSISEGMRDLALENETLLDRAMAAEARAAAAEGALRKQRELEHHLATLSSVVNLLQNEPLDPTMFDVMQILAELPEAPDRAEMHRRLLAKGHENDRARGARHKVVKGGYVIEKGRRHTLHLTDKGLARLAKGAIADSDSRTKTA